MVEKVKIINVKTGEEIRTGSMRSQEINQTVLFGFLTLSDALKIVLTIFGIGAFMIKDNIRINALEEGQKSLTQISQSMQSYMEASDGWHSSVFGTQFKGGRPIDGGFKNHGNVGGKVTE